MKNVLFAHRLLQQRRHREQHDGVGDEERDAQAALDHHGEVEEAPVGRVRQVQRDDVPSPRTEGEVAAGAEGDVEDGDGSQGLDEEIRELGFDTIRHGLFKREYHSDPLKK